MLITICSHLMYKAGLTFFRTFPTTRAGRPFLGVSRNLPRRMPWRAWRRAYRSPDFRIINQLQNWPTRRDSGGAPLAFTSDSWTHCRPERRRNLCVCVYSSNKSVGIPSRPSSFAWRPVSCAGFTEKLKRASLPGSAGGVVHSGLLQAER